MLQAWLEDHDHFEADSKQHDATRLNLGSQPVAASSSHAAIARKTRRQAICKISRSDAEEECSETTKKLLSVISQKRIARRIIPGCEDHKCTNPEDPEDSKALGRDTIVIAYLFCGKAASVARISAESNPAAKGVPFYVGDVRSTRKRFRSTERLVTSYGCHAVGSLARRLWRVALG
jgi:hypothetical protein